jgi:hypothetical protein
VFANFVPSQGTLVRPLSTAPALISPFLGARDILVPWARFPGFIRVDGYPNGPMTLSIVDL